LCLVPFRSQGVENMLVTERAYLFFSSPGEERLSPRLLVLLALFASLQLVAELLGPRLVRLWRAAPEWAFSLGLGAGAAMLFWIVPPNARPFIYFQF
jgi:hypothetical protein